MKGHKRYIIDLHLCVCHFKFDKSNQRMKNFQPIFNTKVDSGSFTTSLLLYSSEKKNPLPPVSYNYSFLLGPPVLDIKKS